MTPLFFSTSTPLRCGVVFVIFAVLIGAPAMGAEKVLYSFQGGNDGYGPLGTLITDVAGNFIGTTFGGGGSGTGCNNGSSGCGTVFELAPNGTESVLHAFAGGCDGANPFAGVVGDKAGNFYGTTQSGGVCNNVAGFGTVYKLASSGTESVLYAFQGGADGEYPAGRLAIDGKGNLYGSAGGGNPAGCNGGCGLVFEVTPKGKKTVVYAFQGGNDGTGPYGDVNIDKAGNLYGTTLQGGGTGCGGNGCGTVFKIGAGGAETVLYAFQGGTDGWRPENGVIVDGTGNLYGTTSAGGADDQGTVFKVAPGAMETVLYSFQGGLDGSLPETGLILDKSGNLYGATYDGGSDGCKQHGVGAGCGTVFKVAQNGTEILLHVFRSGLSGRLRGDFPEAGLLLGHNGLLYGTTTRGGTANDGVVFSIKK